MRWIVPLLLAVAPVQALAAHPGHDGPSYVFLSGKDGSSTINGHYGDYDRAKALRSGSAPLLYARQDGAAYVIRDPAILAQAERIMAPQRELGRRQGALGAQQGKLGAEQGRLGALMAASTPRRMGDLGKQMGDLGRQQGELGRRQGELGREQGRLAKLAQPQFHALVADAIRRGLAQKVD